MTERREQTPPAERKRAAMFLNTGKVTLPEFAKLLGVSTHMLWNWCREHGVDWRKARERVVAGEWKRFSK